MLLTNSSSLTIGILFLGLKNPQPATQKPSNMLFRSLSLSLSMSICLSIILWRSTIGAYRKINDALIELGFVTYACGEPSVNEFDIKQLKFGPKNCANITESFGDLRSIQQKTMLRSALIRREVAAAFK